jgi:hypothetical protein
MEPKGKIGLSVVEAGWLLQKSEAQVRRMLKRGELSYAVDGRLLVIEDVDRLLETALATVCLRWLRRGVIEVPRPEQRWGRPASLFAAFDQLLLASALDGDFARHQPILPPVADGGVVLHRTNRSLFPRDFFRSDTDDDGNGSSSLLCVP